MQSNGNIPSLSDCPYIINNSSFSFAAFLTKRIAQFTFSLPNTTIATSTSSQTDLFFDVMYATKQVSLLQVIASGESRFFTLNYIFADVAYAKLIQSGPFCSNVTREVRMAWFMELLAQLVCIIGFLKFIHICV